MREKLKTIKTNGGSGIITVIVTLSFVAVLATVLLYMGYVSVQMRRIDREGRKNFYNAETAMNEIRAGVQNAVTDAIEKAYSSVLSEYTDGAVDTDNAFRRMFTAKLSEWSADVSKGSGAEFKKLFTYDANAVGTGENSATLSGSYSLAVLSSFLSDNLPGEVNVFYSGGAEPDSGVILVYGDRLVMKNLSVSHASNGYETAITTDLEIKYPSFNYTVSSHAFANLYEFIIVAEDNLTSSAIDSTFDGNVYAGRVRLEGAALELLNKSLVISEGDVSLLSGASLKTAAGAAPTVWANRVILGSGAKLDYSGNLYVANDLEFSGNGAEATLKGNYIGFGSSKGEGAKSSSILINGLNSKLDLSGLSNLTLAGVSFISSGDAELPTGSSMSAKSDQLAYLVPQEYLQRYGAPVQNPYIGSSSAASGITVDLDGLVNTYLEGLGMSGLTKSASLVKELSATLSSNPNFKIFYQYINFDNQELKNLFFKSYFEKNSEKINDYLNIYLSSYQAAENAAAAGHLYEYDAERQEHVISPIKPSTAISNMAGLYKSRYENLIKTLTESSGAGGTAPSPFAHFVNRQAVENIDYWNGKDTVEFGILSENPANPGEEIYTVVGILTKAEMFVIDNSYPHVSVVIQIGNGKVSVEREFNGLIMTEGTVDLLSGVRQLSASSSLVNQAFNSTDERGNLLISYMNTGKKVSSGGNAGEISWDLDTIVTFANWKKD